MNLIRRTLLSLALIAGFSPAIAQVPNFPLTMPSDTFVGRIQPGSGPSSAIPIASLLARITTPNSIPNSVLFKAPAATLKGNPTAGSANVQDFTIQSLPARGAPDANNDKILILDNATGLFKYVTPGLIAAAATSGVSSLGGVTGPITIPAGSLQITGGQLATSVLSSRAFAITQNLSAFSSIQTQGYAVPGDGGHAVFKNVGSASFIDSSISIFSIQGSTGCTNGTYGAPSGSVTTTAVTWQKSGNPSLAIGTATVAGGTVTAVNITGTPGNGFSVGDVLTTGSIAGCSPTITVTGITTALASFIDSAGTHFQFVPDAFPNVLQFGCKGDWNGSDAGATNNFNCAQAAVHFAGYKSSTSFDSGGYWGGRVIVPSGSYMMCGASYFVLDEAVILQGASATGTTLRLCDTYSAASHGFTICDPVWGFTCFTAQYRDISFSASRTLAGNTNIFMIYSNNVQDFGGLYNVYIYPGLRGCLDLEKGYGGASTVMVEKLSCNQGSPTNVMVKIGNLPPSGLNFGSTIVSLKDLVLAGPSSGQEQLQPALQILGGFVNVENVHCEIITLSCIQISIPTSANGEQVNLKNINSQGVAAGQTCNGVIELLGTNNFGNTIIQSVPVSAGCTYTVSNGQSGGTSRTAAVNLPIIFNP